MDEVKKAVKEAFTSYMNNFEANVSQLESLLSRLAAKKDGLDDIERLILRFSDQHPSDCGVLAPLFFNVVTLSPGQSIFVPSNTPHAYVSGQIVECMAWHGHVLVYLRLVIGACSTVNTLCIYMLLFAG